MLFKWSLIDKIILAQVLAGGVFSVCLACVNMLLAVSALLGSLICIVSNLYLAVRLTAERSADPGQLVNTLYMAEAGKLIITAALFAAVFATQEWVHPVALMAGFGVAQLTHWLTPVVVPGLNRLRGK